MNNQEIRINVRVEYDTYVYVSQAQYDAAEAGLKKVYKDCADRLKKVYKDEEIEVDQNEVLTELVWENLDQVHNDSPEIHLQ